MCCYYYDQLLVSIYNRFGLGGNLDKDTMSATDRGREPFAPKLTFRKGKMQKVLRRHSKDSQAKRFGEEIYIYIDARRDKKKKKQCFL